MNEEYDAIVLGTGLKECILSGLLSVSGMKVLHLDRNDYYGGASASLTLTQLFEQTKDGATPDEALGSPRDYMVDVVPKFILATGTLVAMLLKTDVTKYLEFKQVDGSYVVKKSKVHKVPATEKEALSSGLMGMLEKRRFQKFLEFVNSWDREDPKSTKGFDLDTAPMADVFKKFGLDANTIDFIGHALALHTNDSYLSEPAAPTLEKIRLYFESLMRYQGSPYIYPLFGLGELPQAFARLSAIYGGTYMLQMPVDEVQMDGGAFAGVRSGEEVAKAKFVIGDPSYFPDRVEKTGQVVRMVCILDHEIPHTNHSSSVQIIIPQKQTGRNNDIYVTIVSSSHNVAPAGKYLATISTTVETDNPEAECAAGLALVEPVLEKFVIVSDTFTPKEDGTDSKVFISTSYDATSHFETTCKDVKDIYRRITGNEVDLTPPESASSSDA
eukprot:TRINITY_DN627_c0_g1_i1.p2 TRINITY_DN627_c0_g1~~TRINITY_DN627_c0_g1_i1.p2  ORF type:complete len:457 (+),score=199.51 TRINITY_DN627_c0_g1_i1:46-1371(+)